MDIAQKPSASASVIAAAVVAILAGLFTAAVASLGFIGMLLGSGAAARVSPQLPTFFKNTVLGMMVFMICLSVFGIAIGIGLIRLRNWARISVLTWGGLSVFFGVFGGAFALFMPLPPQPEVPNLPVGFAQLFRLIILLMYGLPTAVGVWWLILFTRKGIATQFAGTGSAVGVVNLSAPQLQKARCPVAVLIIAWYFISAAANVVFLPFLPFHFPAVFFGHAFLGRFGTAVLLLNCLLLVVAGVGLLRLKLWSYPFTIALQLIHLASGIITVMSPNFDSLMKSMIAEMYNAMHLPPSVYNPFEVIHDFRWFAYLGLLIPLAIVVLLFYYRERFLEAAAAKSQAPKSS